MHSFVVTKPFTSDLHDVPLLRATVELMEGNRLRMRSQVMVDKATTISRAKVGGTIGHLDQAAMATTSKALAAFLDLTSL